jgi:hypothetical protein
MEAAMAWRIETDLLSDCLVIRIIGNADAQVAGEIIGGVFREIAASQRSRLIVDIREVDGRLSILETFNLVSSYPSMRGLRAAIVDWPENSQWFEFYETVSVNRGYYNRVFTDMEKAKEWLAS